ncbi:MAG: hypothetical protein ABNH53_06185 [Henriciella sp.]|jgi:hypothetical protein
MLTKGDEYPIHQTPEPIAFSGSDRNFYDRYFFNGYSKDGSIFFAASFGVYPHLNVMDGAVSILKDGVQRSVHVSRILGMERMDTKVGPLSVSVVEELKRIHLKLEEAEGLALDVTFTGRHFPVEEPRFTYRQGPRMLIDCTRMTQNGHWSGNMRIDGEDIEVRDFYGTRDRSWGVRPIGEKDVQAVVPVQLPQFYWLWAPINFPNASLYFYVNEDANGNAWNTRSVFAMDGADCDGLMHMNRPQMDVTWREQSRRAASADLVTKDASGREHRVSYEPIGTFMMNGIGYGHPSWGHGVFKGGYAIEREDFTPDNMPWQQPDNLHIQAIVKATHTGPDGQGSEGVGILEQLCIGPHGPSGWKDVLDA